MLKVSENPPIIGGGAITLEEIGADWWVAHTKARAEKVFAWELHDQNIPYFLPMSDRIAIWGGRKRTVLTPIFPSYVFFSGDQAAQYRAFATNRVCQIIPIRERAQFVREIEAIHRAILLKQDFLFCPHAVIGRRCRVKAGALRGMEGVVVKNENVTRLVLEITILGQGASLEISADQIEAVD